MIQRSEEIKELAGALSAAQGQIQHAAKDSANPFFKSSYADLASVWDAIRGPLSKNGLSVMQLPSADGPKVTITTILAHASGQWIASDLTVTSKDGTPQAVGSAITYARRYALQSVAGVAPDDDDGNGAQGRQAAVVNTKVTRMKAGETYAQVSSPEPVNQETDVPAPNLEGLLATMKDLPSCRAAMEAMKVEFLTRLTHTEYMSILADNSMQDTRDFRSAGQAKRAVTALWGAWFNARPGGPEPQGGDANGSAA
jgi:hypothetical protein